MAENISESLFQAIDTIVNKRLQAINFDNTDVYSIIDASKAELGEYKVTDGSVTFTAYSQSTDYKENDAVYVTIPNNDFNQQKLIIGKYTVDSETPFVFTNPTSTMIDVTGNIINGEIQEGGLTANSVNTEEWPNEEEILMWQLDCRNKNYIGFEKLGVKGDFKSWLKDFDCVRGHYGLKIRIYCLNNDTYSNRTLYELVRDKCEAGNADIDQMLNALPNSEEIDFSGAQTDERKIEIILEYVNNKLAELLTSYDLRLDSNDMIGDPFNFTSYHRQEQVFDISNLGQIIKVELYFYQDKGTFFDIFGDEIPYLDDFNGGVLPRNLFTVDPYIMLGYDLNNFNGEQVLLTSTDSLTYKQQDSVDSITTDEDIYNKKYIHLSWLHESDKGIVNIENDTDVDGIYYINWYKKSAGAASPDEWAGVEWELITQDSEGNELGPHAFNYTLVIDDNSYNKPYEQIKAIVIYTSSTGNTTAIRSNIITFSNENETVNNAAADIGRGLTIKCLDGSDGVYYIYRQDYNLIDTAKGDRRRRLECQLYSREFGLEGPIQEAKSITWRIPANNSMIKVIGNGDYADFDYNGVGSKFTTAEILQRNNVTDVEQLQQSERDKINTTKEYEYYAEELYDDSITAADIQVYTNYIDTSEVTYSCKTTGYTYDVENKEIVITWFGDERNGYKINPYLDYLIVKNYLQNRTNNTITCIVNKNNRDYTGSINLRFGTAGTNGTAYTLVIEMAEYKDDNQGNHEIINENKKALTKNTNDEKTAFIARLYDTGGEEIDFYQNENFNKLKFSWYLGYSDNVASYYDSGVSVGLNYYDTTSLTSIASNGDWNLRLARNASGSPQGFTYWKSIYPNYIILSHTNLTMNNLLYLCVELQGWGDYKLQTVYPIPIRSNEAPFKEDEENYRYEVDHINGPTYICYPPDGYPEFYNNPFTLYEVEFDRETNVITDDDIQVDSVIWGIGHEVGTYDEYYEVYHPHLTLPVNPTQSQLNKYNKDLIYLPVISKEKVLRPLDFYIENQLPYGIQAVYGANEIVWTQPIWTYQNDYGSTTLNQWNGKGIQIDEENGTIVSRGIASGKKESDNTFTGVVIGDWGATDDAHESMTGQTGVYGFDHGAMAYAFKDDGTAFIGKSGKGRILFDGNESTITSENFNSLGVGLSVDLDDGIIKFNNIKNTEGTNNTGNEENYFITLDASNNNLEKINQALAIGTGTPNFYVQWDGSLYASSADIQGFIHGSTIDIADGAFWVDENGETQISHLGADDATINDLKVNYLKIVEQLGSSGTAIDVYSDFVMNSDILMQGNEIKQAKLVGGTLYNPELHIYLGTTSTTTTVSYRYERVNNYSASIDYYWLSNGSSTYTHAGFLKYWQYDTYSDRMGPGQFYRRYKVSSSSSSSSDSTGAGAKSPIYIHSGGFSGTYDSSTIVGIIGSTGETYDSKPTAGFKMSAGNYGVILKAHGGGILAIGGGTGGNAYMAEATGTSYVQLSGDVARLHGKGWFIDLGTYNDGPLLKNPNNSTVYDLRYAYFA